MTPLGLDALDKQHWVEHQGPVPVCFDCRNPWPCPTSTLIQALRTAGEVIGTAAIAPHGMHPSDARDALARIDALVDLGEPTCVGPISDETLADIRDRGPKPVEWCIPITKAERDALLARLDTAEAENKMWMQTVEQISEAYGLLVKERDAALARAVPDGWKVKWNIHGVPLLVPAPEEKP